MYSAFHGDIELNNDNLISLRGFRPDEIVQVCIDSAQLSLFDLDKKKSGVQIFNDNIKQVMLKEENMKVEEDLTEGIEIFDGDIPLQDGNYVVEEFRILENIRNIKKVLHVQCKTFS
ncbi:hypothetical protein RYX56_12585 [Alkalihalophilus lindianensis]|uniref:Uncharacterized protein n=1 Tax=Alkalihalophilus lindianensis TaxID=1630542 RepID=A0ABU3XBD0_9BACI|nr:hypothetical protein [Alkalihalophilus lindianensis]MDV2685193.1 hypothetical protein [Alkalihalophilus lindianensis]